MEQFVEGFLSLIRVRQIQGSVATAFVAASRAAAGGAGKPCEPSQRGPFGGRDAAGVGRRAIGVALQAVGLTTAEGAKSAAASYPSAAGNTRASAHTALRLSGEICSQGVYYALVYRSAERGERGLHMLKRLLSVNV